MMSNRSQTAREHVKNYRRRSTPPVLNPCLSNTEIFPSPQSLFGRVEVMLVIFIKAAVVLPVITMRGFKQNGVIVQVPAQFDFQLLQLLDIAS